MGIPQPPSQYHQSPKASPDWKPNRLMVAATANSKKLLAPISADEPAMQ